MERYRQLERDFRTFGRTAADPRQQEAARVLARGLEIVRRQLLLQTDVDLPDVLDLPKRNPNGYVSLLRSLFTSDTSEFPSLSQDLVDDNNRKIEFIELLSQDPKALEPFINGLDDAIDSLDQRTAEVLRLRYGLESEENNLRSYASIGRSLDKPITGERVRRIVEKAERQLMAPELREKYNYEIPEN